ncbi:MAG: DNA polymerase III subunit [Planctomycetota bacterium]|jgi:DNA polymerase III delta' subunit
MFSERAVGHEAERRAMLAALSRDQLPHALLITGESGIGKREFAQWLVSARWCAEDARPCGACRSCRTIESGNHPDLIVVTRNPGKERDPEELGSRFDITVAQIRQGVVAALGIRPVEGQGRAVVIEGADEMNVAAQNALLKTLEEPPGGCVLLLVSAHPEALLETVRSRCQELRLSPLGAEDMARLAPDADATRLALARGRPGRLPDLAALDVDALGATLDGVLAGRTNATGFAREVQELVTTSLDGQEDADSEARHRLAADVLLSRVAELVRAGRLADGSAEAALMGVSADLRRHVPPSVAWTAVGLELAAIHVVGEGAEQRNP